MYKWTNRKKNEKVLCKMYKQRKKRECVLKYYEQTEKEMRMYYVKCINR